MSSPAAVALAPTPRPGPATFALESFHSREPLLLGAVALSAGILAGSIAWRPPWWWLALSVSLLAGAAIMRRCALLAALLALAGMVPAGALLYELRPIPRANPELESAADRFQRHVIAHVARSGLARLEAPPDSAYTRGRPRPSEWVRTLDLETEQVEIDNQLTPLRGGLRIALYAPQDVPAQTPSPVGIPALIHHNFVYGERLSFNIQMDLPETFQNPGAWDYREYLHEQGISALGSVSADRCVLLPGVADPRWKNWQSRFRSAAIGHMLALPGNHLLPPWGALDEDDVHLLVAMIVGEKSQLDRDVKLDFQRTGAYHLLVVSGMNVAIIAAFVFWLARRLRAGDVLASAVTMLLTVLYAGLTDLDAPILRAVLMTAVYLGTRLLFRQTSRLNAIGAAAAVLLALQPAALFDASFQMTFLAVLTIAGIGVPVLEKSLEAYRNALGSLDSIARDANLPPKLAQFRVELRMLRDAAGLLVGRWLAGTLIVGFFRTLCFIASLLFISTLMQLALALPMAVYFHRATIAGLPANIVVVPLMGLLMPVALAATIAHFVWIPLAAIAAVPVALLLHAIAFTVLKLGGLRFAEFRVAQPDGAVVFFSMATIAFALFAAARNRRWLGASAALLACSTFLLWRGPAPRLYPEQLEITTIDVGQGDSILLTTPDGHTMLVDAGGVVGGSRSEFDFGENVVSPYLWQRGISQLDVVALTHAHSDHMGGMLSVVHNFRPRELWVGINPMIPEYRRLLTEAEEMGIRIRRFSAGQETTFGDARIRILAPPPEWIPNPLPSNNDSLVMRVQAGSASVLLEGDAEELSERQILLLHPEAQLLKVGHHGSITSTIPALLSAVHPSYAAISVGRQNHFGHPRREVIERLAAAGVNVYRTDMTGATTFLLDGKTIKVVLPNR